LNSDLHTLEVPWYQVVGQTCTRGHIRTWPCIVPPPSSTCRPTKCLRHLASQSTCHSIPSSKRNLTMTRSLQQKDVQLCASRLINFVKHDQIRAKKERQTQLKTWSSNNSK
jgi:hypothetical protein